MGKYLISFLLILVLLVLACCWLVFMPADSDLKEIRFSIKKGEGLKDIAFNLEKQGLVRCGLAFKVYAVFSGTAKSLKAGEYLLSPSMNIPEIAEKMVKEEVIKIKVTIPEGFTVKQIEEKLGMDLPGENLEGFLFPDTYQFSFDFSGEEVVEKMKSNFARKINQELQEEIEKQGKALFEIIIMASLIEKEVRAPEDKNLVSGILWKRLEAGMPLQVDATLAYLYQNKNWDFDEMRREIALLRDTDSPYNTYKYKGLPLGPICNPGLDSIVAAVYPEKSDYWYYLSAKEGETIFSRNLAEHNMAKVKYLR